MSGRPATRGGSGLDRAPLDPSVLMGGDRSLRAPGTGPDPRPRRIRPVTTAALVLIRGYRLVISPLFPPSCRYTPTCSAYTLEAVERYGAVKGLWMGMGRVARCHPWHEGGYDPVP